MGCSSHSPVDGCSRPYHQVIRSTLARRGRIWENGPTSEVSLMDRPRSRALVLSSLMLATLLAVSPRPVGAQAPSPDAAIDSARSAFEALSDTDRKAIQDALIWTGDYSGVADGTFGRQTFAAIAAFQMRMQQPPNGILAPQARSASAFRRPAGSRCSRVHSGRRSEDRDTDRHSDKVPSEAECESKRRQPLAECE